MTEHECLANLLAADEAQRHAQNGEPRTASALKTELLRDEGRSDMSLQDGLELSGSVDPTPARRNRLFPSQYGRHGNVTTPQEKP